METENILTEILATKKEEVRKARNLKDNCQIVKVPKRKGGYRVLYIPPEPLKQIQKKILKRLLWKIFKERDEGFYGLYRGTSYIQHACTHRNAKWVFQCDLADAFPSVNVSFLNWIFQKKFFQELQDFEWYVNNTRPLLNELKRLESEGKSGLVEAVKEELRELKKYRTIFTSTNLEKLMVYKEDKWTLPEKEKISKGLADLVIELTTFRGILPQGTPTAPFLFYIYLSESGLLAELNSLFPIVLPESQDRYHFQISIYVDNIVVSARKPIPPEKQRKLFKIIEKFGFKINPKKTRHQEVRQGAPLITGLRVNNGRVIIPKRKIRQWRGLIHRALFEPDLRPKVEGLIASLKPIYGSKLPPQLAKPYQILQQEKLIL